MAEKVGVPTVGGFKESMVDYALGLGGALVYGITSSILGSGLIGGLLSAGIAGSTIKGARGEIIATVLGFQTIMSAIGSASASASESPSASVM